MPVLGNFFGSLITGTDQIVDWIKNTVDQFKSIFADVDFTLLYDWLPNDIQTVITACIAVLLVLALFGLIRRILFFLG